MRDATTGERAGASSAGVTRTVPVGESEARREGRELNGKAASNARTLQEDGV
jgi:hypothetical protein